MSLTRAIQMSYRQTCRLPSSTRARVTELYPVRAPRFRPWPANCLNVPLLARATGVGRSESDGPTAERRRAIPSETYADAFRYSAVALVAAQSPGWPCSCCRTGLPLWPPSCCG